MTRKRVKDFIYESGIVIIGSALFAMSMNMFVLPADIVMGGMTGIATLIHFFTKFPVGISIILLNIPLIAANAHFFGKHFLRRTIIGVVATSVFIDLLTIFPITVTDPLMCSILGGVSSGAGIGLLISRGYTTGGTDLIACLLKLKLRKMSTGTLIAVCDIVIIVGAALFMGSFDGVFYSLICTWTMGKVMDIMISGSRRAGQAFIITGKPDEIVRLIFERLDRGVTMMDVVGGYTGEVKRMMMCVVSKSEIFYLKEIVNECDPSAFVIIADASEVTGEGFVSRAAGNTENKNKKSS